MFEELVGWQIIELDYNKFIVQSKTGERKTFRFEVDNSYCCGYSDITTNLFLEEQVRNPVIVSVDRVDNSTIGKDSLVITFYGEHKAIAEITSTSSSGSGYHYGANVTVYCRETRESEILTEW